MNITNSRVYYSQIDIAKALSIFLVVSYHVPPLLTGTLAQTFLLLRMPLFFFISGFLFKYEKYPIFSDFFKRRSKQILLPYFTFFVIFYILWLFVGRQFGDIADRSSAPWQPILEFLRGDPHLVCAPTWFLVVLFLSQILYYFIYRYTQKSITWRILICVALFALQHLFFDYLYFLPFKIVTVFSYLIFYALGNTFKSFCNHYVFSKHYLYWIIPMAGLFYVINFIPSDVSGMIKLLKSALLIGITLQLCNLLTYKSVSKIAHYYSYNAIILLCLQNYLIGVIKIISDKILGYNLVEQPFDPVLHILLLIVVLVLFIPLIFIINRYLPFLIGRSYKTKKRTDSK